MLPFLRRPPNERLPRRSRGGLLLLIAASAALSAATPLPHVRTTGAHGQSSVVGRYILRTVNGQRLPVTLMGDRPKNTVQITDGVLELNADGSYLCRTLATAVSFGLKEPFADTLLGGYTLISPGTIQLNHKGLKPDTLAATGYQITWTHPVRTTFTGAFLYSK